MNLVRMNLQSQQNTLCDLLKIPLKKENYFGDNKKINFNNPEDEKYTGSFLNPVVSLFTYSERWIHKSLYWK